LAAVDLPTGVIVVGEAIMDVAPDPRAGATGGLAMTGRAGGSPANVAVGLARLGIRSRFAGRLSREGFGPFLRAHLERSGVDVGLCIDALEPATMAIVGLDDAGGPTYSFYVEGTADWQWTREELPAVDVGATIHVGSLAIALEPGGAAIADWVAEQRAQRDAFVSLDPNVRPALVLDLPGYRGRLDALIDLAQIVKVSDEDLRALVPETAPLDTARAWAERGPRLVVVTHGAGGATALTAAGDAVHRDATPVAVVDTIGAGDAFSAGLLAFLAQHDALRSGGGELLARPALEDALGFAGRVAAITCGRAGADPPSRADLSAAGS
jgi:fructokinase